MASTYFTVEHLSTKDLIRFFSKIHIDQTITWNGTPCWTWIANKDQNGYGYFKWQGIHRGISRLTFAWAISPIPNGRGTLEVDHLCKNRACCNPVHLELVPAAINRERSNNPSAANRLKTHCKHGHEFTPENTLYRSRKGKGYQQRECKTCNVVRKQTDTYKEQYNAKQNLKYHTDSAYREKINALNKTRHKLKMMTDPEYRAKRNTKNRERRMAQP